MTSITQFSAGGYYQLSGQASGQKAQNNNVTGALLQSLAGAGKGVGGNAAYLLNLSPEAQKYLSGAGSAPANGQSGFVLSVEERETIADIIANYKNEPFTQETFDRIQDDLAGAGLDAQHLALKDKAKSFNSSLVLINALNGGAVDGAPTGFADPAQTEAKSENYMQQIISLWKNMSVSAADADQDEGGVTPVAAAGGA